MSNINTSNGRMSNGGTSSGGMRDDDTHNGSMGGGNMRGRQHRRLTRRAFAGLAATATASVLLGAAGCSGQPATPTEPSDPNAVSPLKQSLDAEAAMPSRVLASFVLLSDLHVSADYQPGIDHLHRALDVIAGMTPAPDAIVVNGDLTNRGTQEEYDLVRSIFEQHGVNPSGQVLWAMGNHEQYNDDWVNDEQRYADQRNRFCAFAERAQVYGDYTVADQHIVVLGPDVSSQTHWAHIRLSTTQLEWLRTQLEADRAAGRWTFVFLHIPLNDTVALTHYGEYAFDAVENSAEVRAVVDAYPHAVLVSGHTHYQWEGIVPNPPGPLYVNEAAVGYTRLVPDEQRSADSDLYSRGMRLVVYSNRVDFECWDFIAGSMVDGATYTHMRPF